MSRFVRSVAAPHAAVQMLLLISLFGVRAGAIDWSIPEQQLARKIAEAVGNRSAALVVENRSSLGRRDADVVKNGLRSVLEGMGVRFDSADKAPFIVTVSLSENPTSYVWVAEIRRGDNAPIIAIVSAVRPASGNAVHDSVPLSLRIIPLFSQNTSILDVAVLEEAVSPTRIAVLDAGKVALYRMQDGKWKLEQGMNIRHDNPWPRDLRGRLLQGTDNGLDVYLPGVICHASLSAPPALNCRNSDDPWPLGGSGGSSKAPLLSAFFSPTRNFFTGALDASAGGSHTVAPFYSGAALPQADATEWIFAGVDGQFHIVNSAEERIVKLKWGSDVASVKTACGSGWQVLASSSEEGASNTVRAYELPERDPVAVSASIEFPGAISALWTEAKGDTAVAVSKNDETGSYESFRVAVACSH